MKRKTGICSLIVELLSHILGIHSQEGHLMLEQMSPKNILHHSFCDLSVVKVQCVEFSYLLEFNYVIHKVCQYLKIKSVVFFFSL